MLDEDDVVDPDGELVVLDDEDAGGVDDDEDEGVDDDEEEGVDDDEEEGVEVDELDVVVSVLPGVVVVVDDDDDAGGVGGTTTVVELELGGVDVDVEDGGVCCWQAPRASRTLAPTAVRVRRVMDRTPWF